MRVVIQRVTSASVEIEQKIHGSIKHGILLLLGIEEADNDEDISWLSGKISRLRIFDDEDGVMNKSVCDVDGEVLLISQFTLHASTKREIAHHISKLPGRKRQYPFMKNLGCNWKMIQENLLKQESLVHT